VVSVNGRDTFVVREEIALMCNTIPPDFTVSWELQTIESYYEIGHGAQVQYEPLTHRTVLRIIASLSVAGRY